MKSIKKLLRFLEKNAGKKINTKEILAYLDKETHKSRYKQKKRRDPAKNIQAYSKKEIEEIIKSLALYKILEITKKEILVKHPFVLRGKASLSPRGMAFIRIRGSDKSAKDIFVSPKDARGLLPEDEVLLRLSGHSRDRFEGRVIKVLSRGRKNFRLSLISKPDSGLVIGQLLDSNVSLQACVDVSRLPIDSLDRLKKGTVIVVALNEQDVRHAGSYYKSGEFVRMDSETDLDPDFARILMKYDLEPSYPSQIKLPNTQELDIKKVLTSKDNRKDCRDLKTITIDGADSKDFDDALSLEDDKNGKHWILYVHIADVSHYVKINSDLDKEAKTRSTSYYLSGRVVPMLPPILSENLCSLVAGKNRLAFTAEMLIQKKDGKIIKSKFYKSVINVDHRLTYESAEKMVQKNQDAKAHDAYSLVLELYDLALKQKKGRMKSGRVDLELPEPWFKTDKNNRDRIESIGFRERLQSSILIEECMLSANTAVAEFLRKKSARVLYRVHDAMSEEKRERLNTFMEAFHIPFQFKDAGYAGLKKAHNLVQKHVGSESLQRIYFMQLLRSFMQAVYSPDPAGHWGLGFKDYCHFTSPIRRYPDLVVHRVLDAIVSKSKQPYSLSEVQDLGDHTSEQERRAMDAERDITKIRLIRYIKQNKIVKFTGYINAFKSNRVYLELEGIPGEAQVLVEHLNRDGELSVKDPFSVFIKKIGKPARLGDKWKLELEKLDTENMAIYCKPVF